MRKRIVATLGPWRSLAPGLSLVLAIIVAIGLGVGAIAFYLPHAMTSAAIESAYRGNIEVADQIKITRGYYTRYVVAKALSTGTLVPTHDHQDNPKAIPLPATFVKDVSDLLKEKDTTLSLISPYPWPHRADRKMDDFQTRAWDAFKENPDEVFSRLETRDGRRVLRVAVADRMTGQTCVSCHNSDPKSAKRDWKLGDVRAVMEVTKVVEPYLATAEWRGQTIIWTVAASASGVALVLFAGYLLVARRTREKHEADLHLHYLAQHDAMTGTLDRTHFINLLTEVLKQRARGEGVAILYIDLDRFKEINDRFGHGVGDDLIRQIADRLRGLLSPTDLLARIGGDEFIIAQTRLMSDSQASDLAAIVVKSLSRPFQSEYYQLKISASVGVVVHSVENNTAETLIKAADIALYRAKSAGGDRFILFTADMRAELDARRNLEKTIREAVENDCFQLYFQPILDRNLKLAGFEALLRLPDGAGGFIPPSAFIRVAEEIGAIEKIGAWVIRRACVFAATWPAHLTVAVNLSPAQFWSGTDNRTISETVRSALSESGLEPCRLELEITEGLLLETTEAVKTILHELKALGVSLVMDDFGTGHSSLSYLWKLPFDKIKIDRSFIAAPPEDREKILPILRTITLLGRTLNMRVTAEGVETAEQAAFCFELPCDQMQGYFFGVPMPETLVAAIILRDFEAGISKTGSNVVGFGSSIVA